MRIVHIVSTLNYGGAERQALNLVRESRRRGHDAWVVALSGRIAEWPDYQGILAAYSYSLGLRVRTAPIAVLRLARWLRGIRPEVVQTHLPAAGLYGRLAAWLAGAPVVITTEHGRTDWKGPAYLSWERFAQRHTAARVAVSAEIAAIRQEREQTPAAKIIVIPNGVPTRPLAECAEFRQSIRRRWNVPTEATIVGFVGRLIELKNVPDIIAAFSASAAARPECHLVVVGDGPERETVEAARRSAGSAAARIHIVGPDTAADRAMCGLDLFVMFSRREGLPMTLLEAMSAGVPAIASAVGEIPSVLAHGGGLTVPAGDHAGLIGVMERLLANKEEMRRLGIAAHHTVETHYSISACLDRHLDLYDRLLNRRSTRPETLR